MHHCANEIHTHCKGLRKANEQDGTVHCLMALAMPVRNMNSNTKDVPKSLLSEQCEAQVCEICAVILLFFAITFQLLPRPLNCVRAHSRIRVQHSVVPT